MADLRRTYRRLRKRFDNPEVFFARQLVKRMTTNPPDVLHLGASDCVYIAADDQDVRNLPAIIADELAPRTLHLIAQGGYHARLFRRYVEIAAAASPARPLLLIGLGARFGDPAWHDHPEYGYARSIEALDRIGTGKPAWRYRRYVRLTKASDFVDYDRLPHNTVLGEGVVGDFREYLKHNHDTHDPERVRMINAYHHGGVDQLLGRYLEEVQRLGELTRDLGFTVVLYEFPINWERAVEVLPPTVKDTIAARSQTVIEAFEKGYGPVTLVPSALEFHKDEYIDPDDGTEHLNANGRLRLAKRIVEVVRELM